MQKTIQINPDFLQITKKKPKKKPKNKNHSLKAKDIKKQLLKKIKDHQIKSQEALKNNKKVHSGESASIEDEFKMSMNYLNKVSDEKKQKKERKKREKKKHAQTQPIKKFKIKEDPPFGVLKGGKKPLYRDYMKTLKKNVSTTDKDDKGGITIHDGGIDLKKPLNERQKKLKKLRKKVKKRNFTIGKNIKNRRIGVLIKNKTLRKNIEDKKAQLKEIHIHDVKKYLRKHGLIRVGTSAPNDVTRTMYEDANSAGNVYNRSPEVLLYNYLNDKGI